MRINLNVPFSQKDLAKAAGARWDPTAKTWFVIPEDVSPLQLADLERFIPAKHLGRLTAGKRQDKHEARKEQKKAEAIAGKTIPASAFNLPECSCASPPWDDCEHTEQVSPEVREMLRQMARV